MRHKQRVKSRKLCTEFVEALKVKSLGVAILLAFVFSLSTAFGQSPEKMSYQAVIRDSDDNLITDTQVGMQISILQDSESGNAVYAEKQEPTTNANGFDTQENDYNMRVLPKFFGIKTSDRNTKIINT